MRPVALLLAMVLPLLVGCPTDDDDDVAPDDDDTAFDDDDTAPDDDDTGPDDDDTGPDDDDDTTPPLPGAAIGNHPSFASDRTSDWSGESVAILGDVNGDGFDDFAIGAPAGGLKEIGSAPGQLFLFFGKAEPDWGVETPLTDADVSWEGTENDDFGFNVIGPGDWNDDGFDDIVVAAPQFPQGNAQAGRLWVISGRASGWPTVMTPIADDAIEVLPEAENSKLGLGLASIGDVNDDGLPDFAANSPLWSANQGRVYVFFGRSDLVTVLAATTADVLLNPGCSTCFGSVSGSSMAGLGDMDGDGIDDFAIGAPQARPEDGDPLGRVYVVSGRADLGGEILLEPDEGPRGASSVIVGIEGNSDTGMGLAGGDLDGDGYGDLLVGAPHNDPDPFDRGALFVFKGRDGGLPADLTTADADWSLEGTTNLESVGYSPALGDFDGDGDLDLALGCPESAGLNDPLGRSGRLYLINTPPDEWGGQGVDPTDVALATWLGDEYPHWVGESVSVGGDINGDGYMDVLVGANKSSAVAERAGQTYLILGGEAADLAN